MLNIRQDGNALIFKIRVQPRASNNEIIGLWEDALRIRVNAAPVEGAANEACCKTLAEKLGISKSKVEIISGQNGRIKQVRVCDVSREQILNLLKKR